MSPSSRKVNVLLRRLTTSPVLCVLALACAATPSACGARSGLGVPDLASSDGGPDGTPAKSDTGGGAGRGGTPIEGTGGRVASGGAAIADAGAGGTIGTGGAAPCADGGVEVCNGLDDDCDGEIDEDLPLDVVDGPTVVRNDEGRTVGDGDPVNCASCAWAMHPQLILSADELGVVWYLGISGGHEEPSGFGRRLSWDLKPDGTVSSLGPQYWMDTLRRGETGPRGTLLAFVERTNHTDRPSFGFVGADFMASDSVPLEGCGGASFGYTVTTLFPGLLSCGEDSLLHLFAIDERGLVLSKHQEDVQAPGDPKTDAGARAVGALSGDRGLVAMPVAHGSFGKPKQLWTLEISADGSPLADPRRQDLDGSTTTEFDGLFQISGGYLLFGHAHDSGASPSGRFVASLGPDGQLRGPLAPYNQGLESYDEVTVIRVGSGFVAAGTVPEGISIEELDRAGSVVRQQLLSVAAYSDSSLLFAHGHLYVAFTEPPGLTAAPNRVLVSRLGCTRDVSRP